MWNKISMLLAVTISSWVLLLAYESQAGGAEMDELNGLATRYAAAWSSGDPDAFSLFYTEDALFRINDGEPSIGREAIAETAGSFMTAFPDMLIRVVEVRQAGEYVEFHWHWTGTNTGPGGTGNAVDITGFEQWTLDEDGLIVESLGNMDDIEYQRQLNEGPSGD